MTTSRPSVVRQAWLDLARGVAVVSMVIAHTCPVGGVFNVTEYLTAPLFALLLGASMAYAKRNFPGSTPLFLWVEFLRGVVLIVLGNALQAVYDQIAVVLVHLGILTWLLALVVAVGGQRPRWAVSGALVGLVALPPLTLRARDLGLPEWPWGIPLDLLVTGRYFRVLGLLVAAMIGLALADYLASGPTTRTLLTGSVAAAAASGASILVGKSLQLGGEPYDGTWPELLGATALAAAVTLACVALLRAVPERALSALIDTGRLALSAYALQIVLLALAVALVLHGRDDSWLVMVTMIVVLVAGSWAWRRFVRRPGPCEWLIRLPQRLVPGTPR